MGMIKEDWVQASDWVRAETNECLSVIQVCLGVHLIWNGESPRGGYDGGSQMSVYDPSAFGSPRHVELRVHARWV